MIPPSESEMIETRDRAISRRRTDYIIRNLPWLTSLEIPSSIYCQPWARKANLEQNMNIWLLEYYRIDKFSGKMPAALGCCEDLFRRGLLQSNPDIYVPSSGNFVKDFAGILKGYCSSKVYGVLPASIHETKIKQIESAGVICIRTPAGMSGVKYAYQLAAEGPNRIVMCQYIEDATIQGYEPAMKHVAAEMERLGFGDKDVLIGGVVGTGATVTAMRRYLPRFVSGNVEVFAVASHSKKEKVPASRSREDFEELRDISGQPGFMFRPEWDGVLSYPLIETVMLEEAREMNRELYRMHYSVGPTGALNTAGLFHLARYLCENGGIEKLRNVILVWMDSYLTYDLSWML